MNEVLTNMFGGTVIGSGRITFRIPMQIIEIEYFLRLKEGISDNYIIGLGKKGKENPIETFIIKKSQVQKNDHRLAKRILARCRADIEENEVWEEEFEDKLEYTGCEQCEAGIKFVNRKDILDFVDKYVGLDDNLGQGNKLKIKARKGAILIEEVKR